MSAKWLHTMTWEEFKRNSKENSRENSRENRRLSYPWAVPSSTEVTYLSERTPW